MSNGIHIVSPNGQPDSILPRCYTVQQIAESLGLSEDTIRAMLQDRPGVLRITKGKRLKGKREYVTLRVPEDVLAEFIQELRGSAPTKALKLAA